MNEYVIFFTFVTLFSSLRADDLADKFRQLESGDFKQREAAQIDLEQWAKKEAAVSVGELFNQYVSTKTPEAKARILKILRQQVLLKKYGRPKGFVGIRMGSGKEKVGEDILFVVQVNQIVKGSPAERYGLKVGDSIWMLDGKKFSEKVIPAQQFVNGVTGKREGDTVLLNIIRGGKQIEINLVLAALTSRIESLGGGANLKRIDEKQTYFERWLENREAQEGK